MHFGSRSLYWAIALAGIGPWITISGAAEPYIETPAPRAWYTMLKPAYEHPAEQLTYARALRDGGHTWRAQRHYRALFESWPLSTEAATALQERAEMLAGRGKVEDAFEDYQKLSSHPAATLTYQQILERQSDLATTAVTRKHYRLFFGGWSAPERALPMLEPLARAAAGWPGAARAQIEIGRIHSQNAEWALAATAFQEYLIRFPAGPDAEEASYGRAQALHDMARDARNDPAIRRDAWSALSAFTRDYPESQRTANARERLERMTQALMDEAWRTAHYYDRHHRAPEAARLAMERFLTLYPASPYTASARSRLDFYERALHQTAVRTDKEETREPATMES